MNRHRYLVAESKVVEQVDGKEQNDVGKPSDKWNGTRFKKEWGMSDREVSGPGEECCDKELDESNEVP